MSAPPEGREKDCQRCPTAGIIVVGDEILKGHVRDTNSNFLAQQLWKLGVRVQKVAVIPDNVDAIAVEVKEFSSLYDYVLTSGGIGPTHDDVTVAGVGRAFEEELRPHPELLKLFFGTEEEPEYDNPWKKMTLVPKSAKVHVGANPSGRFLCPLVTVRNVFSYPGIPSGLKDTFLAFESLFASECQCQFFLKKVFFSVDEDDLAYPLAQVQEEFVGRVQIGSYPHDGTSVNYRVKVTLEGQGEDCGMVEEAYEKLVLRVPAGSIVEVQDSYSVDSKARDEIKWLLKLKLGRKESIVPHKLCQRLAETLAYMEKVLDEYSFDELCVAFNGGKDCTVIMALLCLLLQRKEHKFYEQKLWVVYVEPDQPFKETTQFIDTCATRYGLEVIKIPGVIKEALKKLKSSHPKIKAVFMGTRKTDPKAGSLKVFAETDKSWPKYKRVHCILDWMYTDVWLFLRLFEIPYCTLYDNGYTSLGTTSNTHPNPILHVTTPTDQSPVSPTGYLPAYLLSDESKERAGRSNGQLSSNL